MVSRLSLTKFRKKSANIYVLDLENTESYGNMGDRLIDSRLVITGLRSDLVEISSGGISQGGDLDLSKGNDLLNLINIVLFNETNSRILMGDGDDRLEVRNIRGYQYAMIYNLIFDAGMGNDVIILDSLSQLLGSDSLSCSVETGFGNDSFQAELGSRVQYVDLNTGSGVDKVVIGDISNSNISQGSDFDTFILSQDGILFETNIDTGSGNDRLELNGSAISSSFNTDSGDDIINALSSGDTRELLFNTGSGRDVMNFGLLNSTTIQTGDESDIITAYLGDANDISLNSGDDLFILTGFSISTTSDLNAGEGYDILRSTEHLILKTINSTGKSSYAEETTDSGQYIFTYYGDNADPILIFSGFEQLIFANARFGV